MAEFKVITQSVVHVFITSSSTSFTAEKKFPKSTTIAELKGKLELITGASTHGMVLEVYDKHDKKVCALSNDEAMLGSYPIDDGMKIHVIDTLHKKGEFEDVSRVQKFELSEEEYSQRSDTVKAFLLRNKMGKYNEEEMQKKLEEEKLKEEEEENQGRAIQVGSRCEVSVPGQPTKRGTVQFSGKVHFKNGWWIGVQYDEPLGKNDGSVDGKRYFTCPPKYGGFIKPNHVTVGDFPELFDEELDEM
nr:EOG090X0DT2 [Eulimnadia texana]